MHRRNAACLQSGCYSLKRPHICHGHVCANSTRALHADSISKAASVTRVVSVGAVEELQNEQQEHARLKMRYDEKMKAFADEVSSIQ